MKRRYQAGIIMILISAMIASNLPMTTVFAAAKKTTGKAGNKEIRRTKPQDAAGDQKS